MNYIISTKIYGDRSVFGYSNSGNGAAMGGCSAKDAIDMLDEEYKEYDWKYARWVGDDLIIEFELKSGNDQIVETVELQPEVYSEFLILKKWEKDNGFV